MYYQVAHFVSRLNDKHCSIQDQSTQTRPAEMSVNRAAAAEAIGTGSTVRRAIDGASELVIGMFRAGVEKL